MGVTGCTCAPVLCITTTASGGDFLSRQRRAGGGHASGGHEVALHVVLQRGGRQDGRSVCLGHPLEQQHTKFLDDQSSGGQWSSQ